jgi:cyclopropane-fatty-acyl-phospholipid synthase
VSSHRAQAGARHGKEAAMHDALQGNRQPQPTARSSAGHWEHRVESLLALADVQVDGDRAWDMRVHDRAIFPRILLQGSLGLGETYMEQGWDCDSLDGLLFRLLDARLDERVHGMAAALDAMRVALINPQAPRRSFAVGEQHYDLGNDMYRAMLGPGMMYSCGYWRWPGGRFAADLDAAQEAKLDLVCRKLGLRPGMHVLDIGCGWGRALRYAAEHYGVSGVGLTISREQADYASAACQGLPIEIRMQDYRETRDRFDRVFSIGMFEHVGVANYSRYFDVARRCLAEDGLFLLHSIGRDTSSRRIDPWIGRYIFPNSMLPSAAQITRALEGRFVIEDWHNFGADYDTTLQAWRRNIEAAWADGSVRADARFQRMWRFYLAASMALFRSRRGHLWQLVLSPRGVPGGYLAPR